MGRFIAKRFPDPGEESVEGVRRPTQREGGPIFQALHSLERVRVRADFGRGIDELVGVSRTEPKGEPDQEASAPPPAQLSGEKCREGVSAPNCTPL